MISLSSIFIKQRLLKISNSFVTSSKIDFVDTEIELSRTFVEVSPSWSRGQLAQVILFSDKCFRLSRVRFFTLTLTLTISLSLSLTLTHSPVGTSQTYTRTPTRTHAPRLPQVVQHKKVFSSIAIFNRSTRKSLRQFETHPAR